MIARLAAVATLAVLAIMATEPIRQALASLSPYLQN